MVKRRRRPSVTEEDSQDTQHNLTFSPKADRWFAKEFEIIDGGFFQGRDENGDIIYRLDRQGISLRDLDEPNPIQWESQSGLSTRRSLWVNLPNHPDADAVESGDYTYSPTGGTTDHELTVFAGPDDDLWGARLKLYTEDGTQSYIALQLISTGTPNFVDVLKLSYTTAGGLKMGFVSATPAAKPTGVDVDAAAIHAALVTLGLIAA